MTSGNFAVTDNILMEKSSMNTTNFGLGNTDGNYLSLFKSFIWKKLNWILLCFAFSEYFFSYVIAPLKVGSR